MSSGPYTSADKLETRHLVTLPAWRPAPPAHKKEVGKFLTKGVPGADDQAGQGI